MTTGTETLLFVALGSFILGILAGVRFPLRPGDP